MIIDMHSHIGQEYYNKRTNITLEHYWNVASKIGVTSALIMPCPAPVADERMFKSKSDGKFILGWRWDENMSRYNYFSCVPEMILPSRGGSVRTTERRGTYGVSLPLAI